MSTLFVTSSHNDDSTSQSKKYGKMILEHLGVSPVHRDTTKIPHLYSESSPESFVAEIMECDQLVIATPMWNYGIPSSLKAWIDRVTVSGETFHYDADQKKVIGHLRAKRAYIVVTCGTSVQEKSDSDFITPYLRFILSYLGIPSDQIHVLWVPRTYDDDANDRVKAWISAL